MTNSNNTATATNGGFALANNSNNTATATPGSSNNTAIAGTGQIMIVG